ncbi:MAG: ADOP family duplicated permease [Terriglobia bacterium]
MSWRRQLAKLGALFRRPKPVDDLEEEIRSHLEMEEQENLESGMAPDEAHYAALRRFGNVTLAQERSREMWGWNSVETLWQDLRYGLRMLVKNRGFTAVAVMTLALGIGATTAIFSVIDAVLLHPPPYRNPAQLVEIGSRNPDHDEDSVSVGDFADWQEHTLAFQEIAAYQNWKFQTLAGVGEPDEVWASPVSTNLFHLLGVNAVLGRTFVPSESKSAVLSYEYWRAHFSSDPAILGRTFTLDGQPYTVIGIAPADFEFPGPNAQVWVPLTFSAAEKNNHEDHLLQVIARLKAGDTLKQAQAEMATVASRLAMQYPKTNAGWSASVEPLKIQGIEGAFRDALLALLAAVVFVLMIVCANVAGMLLARDAARQGEMAIRAALGAGRLRLIRQLLVESLLLAGLASVAGLALASLGFHGIVSFVPKYSLVTSQALHRISINLPVMAFAIALSLLTGIVVGLLPALRISGRNLNEWLKQRGRTSGTSAHRSGLQRALVVLEVALALVLLVGAGLMIQSFERLATAPTGFNPDHLLTVRVPLANYKYPAGPQSVEFYRAVLERIAAVPGVKTVAMANNLPFTGFHTSGYIPAPGNSPKGSAEGIALALRSVSSGYFRAMEIPLKAGREFTLADSESNARCVRIVNEAMARRYWPGEIAVGKELRGACPKDAPALIVGVVADSTQNSVDSEVEPELYEPYAQHPAFASFLVTFIVRTVSNPLDLAAAVRKAVWEIDRDQAVIQIRTMENVISESIWRQHFCASMLGVFAAIALVLSAIGVFGVLSYSVTQRTHEIGIRAALGGTERDILRLVAGEGLRLTLIGVGIGIAGALALTRLLAGLLYDIRPRDPITFVTLSLLLTGVALLAVYIPARRATKVDPMVMLRYE